MFYVACAISFVFGMLAMLVIIGLCGASKRADLEQEVMMLRYKLKEKEDGI